MIAPFILAGFCVLVMGIISGWALWTTYKLRLVMAIAIKEQARASEAPIAIDEGLLSVKPLRPSSEMVHREAIDKAYRDVIARGRAATAEEENLLGIR